MEDKERKEMFDSLWPEGKERWFKVKILEQEKAMKNLPWVKDNDRLGFEVTAITCRDEFQPQVVALMDVKDEVLGRLMQKQDTYRWTNDTQMVNMYDGIINDIRHSFNAKIKEINDRTIKIITPELNEQP